MRDLRDSFSVDTNENIQSIVKSAGLFLGWKIVYLSDNEIEFHHSKHLDVFTTTVSWTNDGNINLSSNYRRRSVKADLGGYRKGFNEQIKLSIQNILYKKNNPEQLDNGFNNLSFEEQKNLIIEKRRLLFEDETLSESEREGQFKEFCEKIENKNKPNTFEKKISEKNKSQDNSLMLVLIIGIIYLVYTVLSHQSRCGCSEDDLIILQKNNMLNRQEAIDFCCQLQNK